MNPETPTTTVVTETAKGWFADRYTSVVATTIHPNVSSAP